MRTPERAVWPLPPRPPVLPLPEPMPRPTRIRSLRDPGRSAISLSFIASSIPLDHADEMLDLQDHAARRRIIGQFLHAADLVQPETDQSLALGVMAPLRAAGLLDLDGFAACHDVALLWRLRRLASVRHRFAVDAGAARLQRRYLDVAPLRHRARRILMLQRIECRAHHVVRIG